LYDALIPLRDLLRSLSIKLFILINYNILILNIKPYFIYHIIIDNEFY
jgi:hypothetical protein